MGSSGASFRAGRDVLRFAVTFLGLVAALWGAATLPPAAWVLGEPLCGLIARLAGWVLVPFGRVAVQGSRVGFDGFEVVVVEACNGVVPTTIYLAAVLAFPATWRARAWGMAIGVPAIFLVNLVRVGSLAAVGAHWPELFDKVHLQVWQTLLVALALGLWIFWAEQFARPTARVDTSD